MSFARYLSKEEKNKKKRRRRNASSCLRQAKIKQEKSFHLHINSLENACIRLFDECNRISSTLTRLRWLSSLHTSRLVRFMLASLSRARACMCVGKLINIPFEMNTVLSPGVQFFFPATGKEKAREETETLLHHPSM